MRPTDLDRIEEALEITLPASYREAMLDFPIPAYAGNTEIDLWDDADRLIERNLELRAGSKLGPKPWPPHFYCLGGESTVYAIDLRDPLAPVWWVDHSDLDSENSSVDAPSFSEWLETYVSELRSDLVGDGYDPDDAPQAREKLEARHARGSFLGCLLLVALIILAIFLFKYYLA